MDESRRFTDREVALVLKRAADIDEADDSGLGRGLSLQDVEQIAGEVGISVEAIRRAATELETRKASRSGLAWAPLSRRVVHVVSGSLDQDHLERLIRLIDERTSGPGSVTEVLGTVRWSGSTELTSTHVSIAPRGNETVIQVIEKGNPGLKGLLQVLPPAVAVILTIPAVVALGAPGAVVATSAVLAALAGATFGRLAWSWRSWRSERRVERLAAELAQVAREGEQPAG